MANRHMAKHRIPFVNVFSTPVPESLRCTFWQIGRPLKILLLKGLILNPNFRSEHLLSLIINRPLRYYEKSSNLNSSKKWTSWANELVMGLGQIFLTQVRSGQFFVARVRSGRVSNPWFEFEKFPQKMSNFSIFFPSDQKNLFGWVKKYPGQRRVGLLFTAGQK